jgi:hypothetical protein
LVKNQVKTNLKAELEEGQTGTSESEAKASEGEEETDKNLTGGEEGDEDGDEIKVEEEQVDRFRGNEELFALFLYCILFILFFPLLLYQIP